MFERLWLSDFKRLPRTPAINNTDNEHNGAGHSFEMINVLRVWFRETNKTGDWRMRGVAWRAQTHGEMFWAGLNRAKNNSGHGAQALENAERTPERKTQAQTDPSDQSFVILSNTCSYVAIYLRLRIFTTQLALMSWLQEAKLFHWCIKNKKNKKVLLISRSFFLVSSFAQLENYLVM